MIARFDHHPIQMFLALAIVVCVLMVAGGEEKASQNGSVPGGR
jgi:hypothetical protein